MKRILAAVLALVTAALPPAASCADVVGPVSESPVSPTPIPSVPPGLESGLRLGEIPGVDLKAAAPIQLSDAQLPLRPETTFTSRTSETATPALARSAQAQATAALPNSQETRDVRQVQRRENQIFAGERPQTSSSGGEVSVPEGASSPAAGPTLSEPTGRGPPSRREPPAAGKPERRGASKKALALVALAVVAGVLALTPARVLAVDTLAAQAHGVAADFARFGPFFGVVSAVSAIGYDFSNVVGFIYPLTQIHELFKKRSGDVSRAQQVAGLGSSLLLAFNMFMLNRPAHSTLFSGYQNLFGGLAFAIILGQAIYYSARPGKAGERPKTLKVLAQTGAAIAVLAAATAVLGPLMTAGIPLLHAESLKIPFQMILGFGFAYLTVPGYLKIEREKSVGDASFATTAMFFAANLSLVVWSMFALSTLPGLALAPTFAALTAFAAAASAASLAAFRWLAARKWEFIPEKVKLLGRTVARATVIDVAAFVAVSAFMTALVAGGYFALQRLLGVPHAQARDFATFLFYLVDVILASVSAGLTMRAFRRHKPRQP